VAPRLRRGGFDASGAPRAGVSYLRVICEARRGVDRRPDLLDSRFARLEPAFVTRVISRVVDGERGASASPDDGQSEPRLDAKAAAALLTVEVGAFRR